MHDKLSKEQIRSMDKVIKISIKYLQAKSESEKNPEQETLRKAKLYRQKMLVAVNAANKDYGDEFTDRCLKVAGSLMGKDTADLLPRHKRRVE